MYWTYLLCHVLIFTLGIVDQGSIVVMPNLIDARCRQLIKVCSVSNELSFDNLEQIGSQSLYFKAQVLQ